MKTLDEIKKGLECCIKFLACVPAMDCCEYCPYIGSCGELEKDSLAYIQQLEKMLGESFARNAPALEAAYGLAEKVKKLESKVPKWISVEDELPNEYKDVLAFSNDNEILICHYDGHGWIVSFDGCYNDGDVTHWMYLPQDPRTEE